MKWPFSSKKLSDRYSKLVKLIKSIDSHFQITEDTKDSVRLHLPNYKGNQPMDFHIYLLEPFLYISFVTEIDGEKISCLNNYHQSTDQQDMFNAAMANNLNKIHNVWGAKDEESMGHKEPTSRSDVGNESNLKKNRRGYAIIVTKTPSGEIKYKSVNIEEAPLTKPQREALYYFASFLRKTASNKASTEILNNYYQYLQLSAEESLLLKEINTIFFYSDIEKSEHLKNLKTITNTFEKDIFLYICYTLTGISKDDNITETFNEIVLTLGFTSIEMIRTIEEIEMELKFPLSSFNSITHDKVEIRKKTLTKIIPQSIISSPVNNLLEVSKNDLANAWTDDFGVKYSADKKRLLKASKEIKNYNILEGTMVICNEAFSRSDIQNVYIPDSVTAIGKLAFSSCNNLIKINIPNNITSIEESTFFFCEALSNILIPNKVIRIGDEAFYGCSSLKEIHIPNSVTHIGKSAFCECAHLASIKLPDSIVEIGESAFSDCQSLTEIHIPNNVTTIGSCLFYDCSSLTSIQIPALVTNIGGAAFNGCSALKSINIPNGVTSIDESTFSGCTNLTSISIPNNVSAIGEGAFADCSSLTSISIPFSVTTIGFQAFCHCNSLTSVKIPDSVTLIEEEAFYGCKGLTSIYFSHCTLEIGKSAFEDLDGLKSIYIPKGTKQKFEQLLPDYKDKLVEDLDKDDVPESHISSDQFFDY